MSTYIWPLLMVGKHFDCFNEQNQNTLFSDQYIRTNDGTELELHCSSNQVDSSLDDRHYGILVSTETDLDDPLALGRFFMGVQAARNRLASAGETGVSLFSCIQVF